MAKKTEFEPPLSEGVRKCMKSNKSKDTSPELKVRRALREAGYPGYRLNWKKAPGKPDICYPGRKVAIFVNGCFWHRCPKCNLPLPKHNADYWIPKLERNVQRDRENIDRLEADGWTVVVLWGCDLKKDFDGCIRQVVSILDSHRRGILIDIMPYAGTEERCWDLCARAQIRLPQFTRMALGMP